MPTLDLYMNGKSVGKYVKRTNGANEFQYDANWLNTNGARPISLSLPLRTEAFKGDEVYNYFDNLLPDNQQVRERILARHNVNSTQAFDLLSSVGRDCVGALQFVTENSSVGNVQNINYTPLTEDRLEAILSGYLADAPLGMIANEDDFRISIAGAQEKTALLFYEGGWCIPHGTTPTTHIFKLPIGEIKTHSGTLDLSDSVENEYLCLLLAREMGFDVPHCEILNAGAIKALAVERFDRKLSSDGSWIMRLTQEDFCQVLGVAAGSKYESHGGPGVGAIMKYLMGSAEPLKDRHTFMRAQVFFWLLGAIYGHAKNFSVFISAYGGYKLTPLYDIISAYPITGGRGLNIRELQLAMGLKASNGRKYQCEHIFPRHFLQTAKEVGFNQQEMAEILRYFHSEVPKAIKRVEATLPADFPAHVKDPIIKGVLRMNKRLADIQT